MDVRYQFKCAVCGHVLLSSSPEYLSPCPLCNGFLVLDLTEVTFDGKKWGPIVGERQAG